MYPYICISYAASDGEEAEQLFGLFARYGFRYSAIHEKMPADKRSEIRSDEASSLLVVLTSPNAARAESCAEDIRRSMECGRKVLAVSLSPNELDDRFFIRGRDNLIAYPESRTPDSNAVAVFMHNLFVRYLSRFAACFSPQRCVDDLYGRVISHAVRARGGDYEAQYALGRAYETGEGVPIRGEEAAFWIRSAAENGVPDARIRMGELYLAGGKDVARDPIAALRLFAAAAADGDVRGFYHRGLCYLWGYGVMKDPERAVWDLKTAADAGYAPAQYELALIFRDGIGVPRNGREAVRYLYLAAMGGRSAGLTPVSHSDKDATLSAGEPADEPSDEDHPEASPAGEDISADPDSVSGNITEGPVEILPDEKRFLPRNGLYGRRRGGRTETGWPVCRYHHISMRQMRRIRLIPLLERAGQPTQRDRGERYRLCFARSRVHTDWYPEDIWLETEESENRLGRRPEADLSPLVPETRWGAVEIARAAAALGEMLEEGSPDKTVHPSLTRALCWYRFAVRLGHNDALFRLADVYRRGCGVPADPARAVRLYHISAAHGSIKGQFSVGVCCEQGIGERQNLAEAVRYYEQAAASGYAPAETNLGGCYEYGRGVVQNQATAVDWYSRAAETQYPDAQCRLGLCYEMGRGVTVDRQKAFRLYESAARQGHGYALYRLALCYDHGIEKNDVSGAGEAAGASSGTVAAAPIGASGRTGESSRTGSETRPLPLLSAPEGVNMAVPVNFVYAAKLYARAAAAHVPEAAYAMYLCSCQGRGVRLDEQEGFRWLTRAARMGHLQALFEMGMCYMDGQTAVRNREKAVSCFEKAADRWRAEQSGRFVHHLGERDVYPTDALTKEEAAGHALYMLGYCTLYRIGQHSEQTLPPDGTPAAGSPAGTTAAGSGTVGTPADALPLDTEPPKNSPPIREAARLFREAAEAGHIGAMTALGDLYTFDLLEYTEDMDPDKDPMTEKERRETALSWYIKASQVRQNRRPHTHGTVRQNMTFRMRNSVPNSAVDALMSLYERSRRGAEERLDEGEPGDAEVSLVHAWNILTHCVELGSADAQIGLARQTYGSRDGSDSTDEVQALLESAEQADGGRVLASLMLGDLWFSGWLYAADEPEETPSGKTAKLAKPAKPAKLTKPIKTAKTSRSGKNAKPAETTETESASEGAARVRPNYERADQAYRKAIAARPLASECGKYTLLVRRNHRLEIDRRAVAEAYYHMAILCAVHLTDKKRQSMAFRYLCTAVRMGHAAARDDLARMYAYETGYIDATGKPPKDESGTADGSRRKHARKKRREGKALSERALIRELNHSAKALSSVTLRDPHAGRSHKAWLSDYYTSLWQKPVPFGYTMADSPLSDYIPDYVRVPVTDIMRARALNYVGDCFFFGEDVDRNPEAAVACYREVVHMRIPIRRTEAPPMGIVWAQYSYGWCLLHGAGVPTDLRKAVKWLSRAARFHGEAAYALAECYENGWGVDVPDDREAIKFYRKSMNFGYRPAAQKVSELDKRLRDTN